MYSALSGRWNTPVPPSYVEIPKKNGKSELAAAVALYLLYADNEPSAEVRRSSGQAAGKYRI
jgi:hypothetical protein